MVSEFGWSSAATSGAFALSIVVEGAMSIIIGGLADKLGPHIILTLSGFLLRVGYLLMSQVSALWLMYLFYGLIIGTAMGGFFVTAVSVTARWFTRRRSLMTGVVLSGVGIGMLIASPIANYIIYSSNWRTSYLILGSIVLIVVILLSQFLKRDPAVIGRTPYGHHASTEAQRTADANSPSIRDVLCLPQFWLVFVIFFCTGFGLYSTHVHLVPYAIEVRITPAAAAGIMSLSGGISVLGRLLLGFLADRIGNKQAIITCLALLVLAFFWLSWITTLWAFVLFAFIFGLGQGGIGSAQPPLVAELFGLKSLGLFFGILTFGFSIGGALGPYVSCYLFDVTGIYHWSFLVSSMVGVIGIIATAVLRPVNKTGTSNQLSS